MIKVVFDTNILISGLLHVGKPKQLIDLALNGKIESVSSLYIINEFSEVISRDKFELDSEKQELLKHFVFMLSNIVDVKSTFKIITKDPSDDNIVRAAYDGNANYIVSGDKALLELREFAGIKI